MQVIVGSPVRKDDFFDREELLGRIWGYLATGSILLAAPRRVGKTSLMFHLLDHPKSGFDVVFVDAQGCEDPEELVADMILKLADLGQERPTLLGRIFGKVTEWSSRVEEISVLDVTIRLREAKGQGWREAGERALREVLKTRESKIVVMIDELPLLLHKLMSAPDPQGKQTAHTLLDWLRRLRSDEHMSPRLRFVLAGSIGLPRVAEQLGASHKLNDITAVPVNFLHRDKARELARRLLASRNVTLTGEAMEVFLDRIETFLPLQVQQMASSVASEIKDTSEPPTKDLIERAYRQRVLGPEFKLTWDDYYERLDRYYAPREAAAAKAILRSLSRADTARRKSTLLQAYLTAMGQAGTEEGFETLMSWLESDFYISCTNQDCFAFRVRWLKDWWRKYHG